MTYNKEKLEATIKRAEADIADILAHNGGTFDYRLPQLSAEINACKEIIAKAEAAPPVEPVKPAFKFVADNKILHTDDVEHKSADKVGVDSHETVKKGRGKRK